MTVLWFTCEMSLIDSPVWTLGSSLVTLSQKVMELSNSFPESKDPTKLPNGITVTFSHDIWALSWDCLRLEHSCDFQPTLNIALEDLYSREAKPCFPASPLPVYSSTHTIYYFHPSHSNIPYLPSTSNTSSIPRQHLSPREHFEVLWSGPACSLSASECECNVIN